MDDLRTRIAKALGQLRFGLNAKARYGLAGREVEEATEQLLPFVEGELDRLAAALETLTAQAATALAKRDKAKQQARIAGAELEALRGGLREIGGDPTQVQNLYAQLTSRTRQWKAAEAASETNDAAWGSVWLHGKWSWLTKNMTTSEREYAADCVARWSARLAVIDGDPDRGEPDGLRWWREPQEDNRG